MAKKVEKLTGQVKLANGMIAALDMRAMVEVEDMANISFVAFIDRLGKEQRVRDFAVFMFACLKRHQPDLTLDAVIDILHEFNTNDIESIMGISLPESGNE